MQSCQPGAVDDPHLVAEDLLELPDLTWGEFVVEEDVRGILSSQDFLQFLRLARADPGGRVGAGELLGVLDTTAAGCASGK